MPRSLRPRLVGGLMFFVCALASTQVDAGRALPIALPVDQSGFSLSQNPPGSLSKAAGDSFVLFGGPGEGNFQNALAVPDRQGWLGVDRTDTGAQPPVGEFSKVFASLTEIDPCAQNSSPQMTFIDDGSSPSNLPGMSTGGSTSSTFGYGLPGGWVVNFSGGLSTGAQSLFNEVWSPEILWDDPSTAVDDAIAGGATLRYDAWMHLPLANGIFHSWAVRSIDTSLGATWSDWRSRGYVYYSEEPQYLRRELEVADLLVDSPDRVQIALGVIDLADEFGLPGTDATPSPWIDNVSFVKHAVVGPIVVVDDIDRFHDSFSHAGTAFDPANPAAQVIRVDTGRDINPDGLSIVSGDSMVVRAVSPQAGVTLAGPPTMTWYLRANPLFDNVRIVPTTATQIFAGVWKGTLTGLPSTDASGAVVSDTWYFDFADGPPRNPSLVIEAAEDPFFFPGDRLWVYVEATDTNGDTNFWLQTPQDPPQDGGLCGGGLGKPSKPPKPPEPEEPKPIPDDGLPGIWEEPQKSTGALGIHIPRILVWDDAVDAEELDLFARAMAQIGVLAGEHYDVYSTFSPESGLSNGLGASEGVGATALQLAPYDILFYLGGSAPVPLISDGSGILGNDKGDDLGVIQAWLDQEGDRAVVSFADHLASAMTTQGSQTAAHLRTHQGIDFIDDNVADVLTGQVSPRVTPSATAVFTTEFVVWGGCESPGRYDEIEVLLGSGASEGHAWTTSAGSIVSGPAASVMLDTNVVIATASYRRAQLSFPFAFRRIRDVMDLPPSTDSRSARSMLLAETLAWLGVSTTGLVPVVAPDLPKGVALGAPSPNPFNPTTKLWLSTDRPQHFTVEVFDLRGRRIASLYDGVLAVGRHAIEWRGFDSRGASVASGTYILEARNDQGWREVRRLALVK
jgi:hypothetical protein